jgi:SagB-type dehydrogenase family enzyme
MKERPGEEFMFRTRYEFSGPSDQQLGKRQPPLFRRHPAAGEPTLLPPPGEFSLPPADFPALITSRVSRREYTTESFSLAELSWLLWATQGVKGVYGDNYAAMRTVPSAGARHALETYLVINRVAGLEPGLYQFLPLEHAVARLANIEAIARKVSVACLGQAIVVTSAVTIIWTAVPYRMTWRYGQRGYRYLHLDAGHVCQNLYQAAEALKAGCCAIAAFDDERMADLLKLDPAEEFVIYLATVGKVARRE